MQSRQSGGIVFDTDLKQRVATVTSAIKITEKQLGEVINPNCLVVLLVFKAPAASRFLAYLPMCVIPAAFVFKS